MGQFDLKIPIECPSCRRSIELPARSSGPGTRVRCRCGQEITLAGDDLRKIQKALDGVADAFRRFGR
jgi:hypothetical protein